MIDRVTKIIFALFCIVLFAYLVLPNFEFPAPPQGSLQSNEPADTETPLRRAYFTDFSRDEVINWYKSQMSHPVFFGMRFPIIRMNYPPEDAQSIIRDQTRSTFLEEIVHPMRESIYINGFEPKDPKDAVIIEGRHFRQKIIIRFVPSSLIVRLVVFVGIVALSIMLYNAWKATLISLREERLKFF